MANIKQWEDDLSSDMFSDNDIDEIEIALSTLKQWPRFKQEFFANCGLNQLELLVSHEGTKRAINKDEQEA